VELIYLQVIQVAVVDSEVVDEVVAIEADSEEEAGAVVTVVDSEVVVEEVEACA